MRKQIDLPKTIIKELELQAKSIHPKMKFKPFAESILAQFAYGNLKFKSMKSKTKKP